MAANMDWYLGVFHVLLLWTRQYERFFGFLWIGQCSRSEVPGLNGEHLLYLNTFEKQISNLHTASLVCENSSFYILPSSWCQTFNVCWFFWGKKFICLRGCSRPDFTAHLHFPLSCMTDSHSLTVIEIYILQ